MNYMLRTIKGYNHTVPFDKVKEVIAQEFEISIDDLKSRTNKKAPDKYSLPRMMGVYIGFYSCKLGYRKLQEEFNVRSNRTIRNANEKISGWLGNNKDILAKYIKIQTKLESYGNIQRE